MDVGDPAGDRVVDRDHRQVGLAALDRREDVLERRARPAPPGPGSARGTPGGSWPPARPGRRCVAVRSPLHRSLGDVALDRGAHGAGRRRGARRGRGRAAPYAAGAAATSTRCPRTSSGCGRRWPRSGRRPAGALRHLGLVRYDAFADVGGRLSWSLALRRRRRQRRRADRDPRPQRGAQLRQEHRRLDLRAADVTGGGGRRGVREAVKPGRVGRPGRRARRRRGRRRRARPAGTTSSGRPPRAARSRCPGTTPTRTPAGGLGRRHGDGSRPDAPWSSGCGLGADSEHLASHGWRDHGVRHLAGRGRRGRATATPTRRSTTARPTCSTSRTTCAAPSTWSSRSTRSRRCTPPCASARSPASHGLMAPGATALVVQVVRRDDEPVTDGAALDADPRRDGGGRGRRRRAPVARRGAAAGPGQPALAALVVPPCADSLGRR